jgi:Tol biopolymer transport system component
VGSSIDPLQLPDGSVVFATTEGDKNPIYLAAPDGSSRRTLVSSGLGNFALVHAERAGILFTQISEKERALHVWRVDADGGGLRQLTQGTGELLGDVSPDGTIALFSKLDDRSLWSLNPVSGGDAKPLGTAQGGDLRPSFSPDGRLARYAEFTTVDGRVYARLVVIPSGGGEPVARVLLPPGATFSTWSPDSASMTYIDQNRAWNLMRQPIAGGPPTELTKFTEGVTTGFAWAPDGSRLVVVRRIGQKVGLYAMQPGKGEPKLLVEFRTGNIFGCRFAPDSKGVVFTYGTSSKDVVLISDFQ